MTHTELQNIVVSWFQQQSMSCKERPCRFKPMEITNVIGGAYTSLGRIQKEVVGELSKQEIKIRYIIIGNERFFELF
jgi:hypothetical protein